MAVSVGQVEQLIEKIAPRSWAEDWDNPGLLVGNSSRKVERIILSLDATLEVVEEAVQKKANLIISHHPLMFKPLKNLRSDQRPAIIPLTIFQKGISFYAAHTNLDQSELSSSLTFAKVLELKTTEFLSLTSSEINTGKSRGYGIIGYLPQPVTLGELWGTFLTKINNVSSNCFPREYDLSSVRLAGNPAQKIKKVAIINGSGSSFVSKAIFQGADLFITGDIDYHGVLDSLEAGMAVGELGHFFSEIPMIKSLFEYLSKDKTMNGVQMIISEQSKNPWERRG